MSDVIEPSSDLVEAMWEAVDHAVERIRVSGGSLRPFLMTWEPDGSHVSDLMGESMEDSVVLGRQLALQLGPEVVRCVLAWDAYVTVGGVRGDAIVLQAYERDAPVSHILVQRYAMDPASSQCGPLDNLALVEQTEPMF